MDGHIAQEWKYPNPGSECLMPSFLTDAFPPGGSHGGKAGFEKHGLPAAATPCSPKEEAKPLPMTPRFGHSSSSLAERMQARAGFSVAKLSMPCIPPAATAADGAPAGAPSPYLTIPPGLSPATLLESPVFLSNAMGQASPTTGKLLMLGVTNDNAPTKFEVPSVEDSHVPGAFSFKPLDLKSSQYMAQGKKEPLSNKQHPSFSSAEVSVKTETNIQTVQEANLLSHLNQQQSFLKNGGTHDPKLNRLPSGMAAVSDSNASLLDHGQPSTEGDAAKGDYPAMAAAAALAAPAEDGYSWRKYGQKQVKNSEYPRSYYKCTHPNCQVKKKVERSHEGHITEIIYKGTHGHQKPAVQSRRPSPSGAQADAAAENGNGNPAPGSQPNVVEARAPWQNNGGVGAGEDWRGDGGLEATSSPGELCDTAASMQVHDGAARFESPEGVDGTSAVSDEVDDDDGAQMQQARGGMSQNAAAAEAEADELESKRRKLESCAIEMGAASRAVREPRVVIQTTSDVDILDDGYRWRKYGQKVVKGNPNPRSYYKCTHPGCMVRKHVERASHDLKSVITTYEGKHNHEVPAARNSGHPAAGAGASQPHAGGGARRPEPPTLAQDGLMRLGSCGAPLAAAFGLPPRDPLAPMSNFPFGALGGHAAAALPSLPMPSGLAAVEGLKLPALPPSLHPLLRHRQVMETAGLMVVPKGEPVPSGAAAGASAAPPFQHMLGRLPVRHQM